MGNNFRYTDDVISAERLGSVEPIVMIVGQTVGGDMLIEDRNGNRYSLTWSLVENARKAVMDRAHAEELAAVKAEVSPADPDPVQVIAPIPASNPKRAARKKAAKK